MGVNLKDIIPQKEILFEDLAGKTLAVDALNSLYQFLAGIRQPDGTPLMNSQGETTSHLSGLFYRTTKLIEFGINPIYVFDGKPIALKQKELDRRRAIKEKAKREWDRAKAEGRTEDARKHAKRTSKMTPERIEDSKTLLKLMGLPVVSAPAEGEAQCALLVSRGDAFAAASQDYDSLLFGAARVVRGLTLSGSFTPSIIELDEVFSTLGVDRKQLIDIALLVGTDFNDGVHGIGPKKGIKAVKEGRVSELIAEEELKTLEDVFLKHDVTEEYDTTSTNPDVDGLIEFLNGRFEFNEARVKRTTNRIIEARKKQSQQKLGKWF